MTPKQLKRIQEYFEQIEKDQKKKVTRETSLKPHFMSLVRELLAERKGHLTEEHGEKTAQGRRISYDARLIREDSRELGLIEAKDDKDDLEKEIVAKIRSGYRTQNILFWQPKGIRLLQDGQLIAYNGETFIDLSMENELNRNQDLFGILNLFLSYESRAMGEFNSRKDQFLHYIQEQANWLRNAIKGAQESNSKEFTTALAKLQGIFSSALDTELGEAEITDWAIQHFFMRSVFTKIFSSDFLNTNPISRPLESLLQATARAKGLRQVDDLWQVNEAKALYHDLATASQDLNDDAQKQHFLNQMYERFFQNYSQKSADKFGVVYTPPEVVRFMLATTDHLLKTELSQAGGLSQAGVKIIDPFVGTGNFLVHLIKDMDLPSLETKFKNDLFANEIQLMPYYISQVNLSDAFYNRTGQVLDFHNLALADTFDLLENNEQPSLFAELEENTETIRRQKEAGITVVIGNPPYNMGQKKEDDNNKNKKHKLLDDLVRKDYAETSQATLKNKLSDVYVKAFRWSTERLKNQDKGMVAFVSNNSFIESQAFDGMRQNLLKDFAKVLVVNLRGNVRKNTKISGTMHNIFGIQVGVSITFLVKNPETPENERGLYYQEVENDFLNRYERLDWLDKQVSGEGLGTPDMAYYTKIEPQKEGRIWLTEGLQEDFESLIPLGSKEGKASNSGKGVLFHNYGLGIVTSRDAWAYNFSSSNLQKNMKRSINFFNNELGRYITASELEKKNLDQFLAKDPTQIAWTHVAKTNFKSLSTKRTNKLIFNPQKIRTAQYRPFLKKNLYFDSVWNERRYQHPNFYPNIQAEHENFHIAVSGVAFEKPDFGVFIAKNITNLKLVDASQCFPFYTYSPLEGEPKDGEVTRTWGGVTYLRRENVTDWALEHFKAKLGDDGRVTKEAIFYYTYAVLNHPDYAGKYNRNLRGSLARIGLVKTLTEFDRLAGLGRDLANQLLDYDSPKTKKYFTMPDPTNVPPHLSGKDQYLSFRPDKMKLGFLKDDKEYLRLYYNPYVIYDKIPQSALEFKIEGRSPLEWFIKNWVRKVDKESGIVDDPAEYQAVGADKADPFYAWNLIPKLVEVGVQAGILQKKIAEIPLDWQP